MVGKSFSLLRGVIVISLFAASSVAFPAEFKEEIERDYSIRSIGRLIVTNLRGTITVHGWPMDKVRVKAVRRVIAENEMEARALYSAMDFRYRAIDGDIELSAEYGKGMDLQQRLRERQSPRTAMDITVMAPAGLSLSVWGAEGAVTVKPWAGPLEVRTASGAIDVADVKKGPVSLLCKSCAIHARNVRGTVRCMGGDGDIRLSGVEGDQLYVESAGGKQFLEKIRAEQLYVSRSGDIRGTDLEGHIEFNSQSGKVELEGDVGFASGRTESGDIRVRMAKWKFADKAIIESQKGKISLILPPSFAAEVDVWSFSGKTQFGFPFIPALDARNYGPEPPSHVRGKVGGRSNQQLRVYSREGDVEVRKGL